ncbi:hypothetical protein BCR35DRAFT_296658 [Leucosporidium creatinivorum]|uniref:FAD-binding FR-type domain-containing protein n=1 Tax=Leucosporidium creatinivorum TaxID=106004 RepID=A0A1Y2D5R2_9BASI|nr:hypothetical protein BCR35DRAFT_296658 [Leucosporidium creatinivorum]
MIRIETQESAPPYPRWPLAVRAMQEKVGVEYEAEEDAQHISPQLSDQHRDFHAHHISFLPLATKDKDGRVWASLLAGEEGLPGFISAPSPRLLQVDAPVWPGDPVARTLVHGEKNQLVAGVGVELWSRRRNKLAGHAEALWSGNKLKLNVAIDEALGNCPKYITIRDLLPHPRTNPSVELTQVSMASDDVLPSSVISFIKNRDTLFLATSYLPSPTSQRDSSSHLGCNHRGGRPGFVRVCNDQRTLVFPDLSGNRHMTSLGNILSDPHVGVVFPEFETGDVLYLTGEATNLVGEEASEVMPRANVITLIKVTGYTLVKDALPFRQPPGSNEPSPYSPPVRFLAEEQDIISVNDVKATLKHFEPHADDLATFVFEASAPPKVIAGQYAVVDLTPMIGSRGYQHMARRGDEATLNDDGIRTWTIASPPSPASPNTFALTIRKIPGGRISPRLFSLGVYFKTKTEEGNGAFVPKLEVPLLGVGGSFTLPKPTTTTQGLLFIAGGIGITPFLAQLQAIVTSPGSQDWNVQLLVSTREPQVMLDLVDRAISHTATRPHLRLSIHLFSPTDATFEILAGASVELHKRRFAAEDIKQAVDTMGTEGKVYLCGPPAFETSAQAALRAAGIAEKDVETEKFTY